MFIKIIKTASVIFCSLLIVAGGVCVISNSAPADLGAKSFELKSYCRSRGYNTDYGILVDYSIHSFQQRFYVVDLNTGEMYPRLPKGDW